MNAAAECKNCGAALWGPYCSACGQRADVAIPSLGRALAGILGDLYDFDSRVWRTVVCLVLLPGRLTRRYIAGRRAAYTPPFRLYFVTSVVFFLLFSLGDRSAAVTGDAAPAVEPVAPPVVDAPSAPDAAADDSPAFALEVDEDGLRCVFGPVLPPDARSTLERMCAEIEPQSGEAFARAFLENVPVMMLVFIPLIALLMKALYPLSRRKYFEHLVFFLHVHALFFLLATLTSLISRAASAWPILDGLAKLFGFLAWSYFAAYLFLAMRHVYAQGRALTAVKYATLGIGYITALVLTLLVTVLYTAVAA